MNSKKYLAIPASIVGAFALVMSVSAAYGGFPDVDSTDWYADGAKWAGEIGVVEGINGDFVGNGQPNRAQVVTMLKRYNDYLMVEMGKMQDQMDMMEEKMTEMEAMMGDMNQEEPVKEMMYSAMLTGGQEVPAVNTDAMGMAEITVKGNMLTYKVTVEGLSGDVTGAHFHMGAMGENGESVHTLADFANNMSSGTWEMTDEELKALMEDGLYLNVHTAAHTDGEIRGQVMMEMKYEAMLDGAHEVPVVNTDATAKAELTMKDGDLMYTVTVTGIENADITGAHFHMGAMGENGEVLQALEAFTNGVSTGTWTDLTAEEMKALMDGMVYVNVHTAAHTDGEIRGQVMMK